MFGIAAFVLLGLVGAAFDYSRAALVQTGMQRAVDSAALLAARNRETVSTHTVADGEARVQLRSAFDVDQLQAVSISYTVLEDRVRVEAQGQLRTTLTNVIGFRNLPVSSTAEAIFGDTKVEIALVLDNTGSMNQNGKLATLKEAAHNFLNKMQANGGNPEATRIAIVPFDTNVNLGSLRTSSWVDPASTGHWTSHPRTTGCIWDRKEPNDVSDTAPVSGDTLFSADPTRTRDCSIGPILPLTSNYTDLHASITGMAGGGNTNTTIGLVWGYHVLSRSEPITNAAAFGTRNLTKYLILMTDGDNTQNRSTQNATMIDNRTRQVCDNIRAAGVQVFTARIVEGNASLLQGCATQPSMYYDVQSPSQLEPVFNSIYAQITGTRLAR